MIYFDNNATTQVDDNVIKAMLPYFNLDYGNASSAHPFGWRASGAVERSTEIIAECIGSKPEELIYTSGATESVNMILYGVYRAYSTKGNHIISVETEHPAVLDVLNDLKENHGAEITLLKVDREGMIDLSELKECISDRTILVSVMAANNEIGVMQDIEQVGSICEEHNTLFFTDATQFVGKMRMDVMEMNIHIMAFSAHKFHGPKGIGAIYFRRRNPRISLLPLIRGGAQQNNMRSGTLNVPGIVGMAKALKLFSDQYWDINEHVSRVKNHLEHQLLEFDGLRINGNTRNRIYNTSSITFPERINLKPLVNSFAFSSGSACSSGSNKTSHVLKAIGLNEDEIRRTYRFSFSRFNTIDEVDKFLTIALKA